MGSSKTSVGVMGFYAGIIAMMIMACGVTGQGPVAAPPSGDDCESVVLKLADCLGYVSGSDATPPATCCGNLSTVIDSTPQCLCQLYNTSFTGPLGVNITRAMMLPPACKLSTPSPSLCSSVGIPVPGPSLAPTSPSGSGTAPSSVPTPSGQGPVAAPTSGGDCESVVLELVDCLGYVTGSDAMPPATCCGNLSTVIESTPQCLCQLYNTSFTEPLGVNLTRAMMLPPACKLSTPNPSLCSLVGIPVPGPSLAPMSPSGSAVTPAGAPGTQTPPATNASPPPEPSSAYLLQARSIAVVSSLLFAVSLLFH